MRNYAKVIKNAYSNAFPKGSNKLSDCILKFEFIIIQLDELPIHMRCIKRIISMPSFFPGGMSALQ